MAQWEGKSRGTVLGYKIFIFLIKNVSIHIAYFVLYFVAFYFLVFSTKGTKASFYYFHNRLGFSKIRSVFKVYKNNYVFGQTLIDKVAISSGLRNKFTFDFDGIEILKDVLAKKEGGILISAHIGNFEIAEYFFSEIDEDSQINLVVSDLEHEKIKNYLESVSIKTSIKFIIVEKDLSHVFEINNALSRNELVCLTGDRYFEGSKVLYEELLGKVAPFPAGTFLLGSRLNAPVIFTYIIKESSSHYHFYARRVQFQKRNAQDLLKKYTESITWILKKHPYQWFNYFDFWKDIK